MQKPTPGHTFRDSEHVAVFPTGLTHGQACGCTSVKKLKSMKGPAAYKCPACDCCKKAEQQKLLEIVKDIVHAQQESIWVFVEFPLLTPEHVQYMKKTAYQKNKRKSKARADQKPRRADVLLVPEDATSRDQVLVIELDGKSHDDDPFQFGQSREQARAGQERQDIAKNRICADLGMKQFRFKGKELRERRTRTLESLETAIRSIV